MDRLEIIMRIDEIEREIAALTPGNLAAKTVKGKEYYYHRITRNDPQSLSCQTYEVKYSKEVVSNQYRHLIDKDKCAQTEHRFGTITGKYVIYRGDKAESDGIQYLNVEDYLKSL